VRRGRGSVFLVSLGDGGSRATTSPGGGELPLLSSGVSASAVAGRGDARCSSPSLSSHSCSTGSGMAAPADGGRRCPQQRDRGSLPPRRRAFSCAALLAFCTVALLPLAASMSLTGQEDKSRMTETLSRLSASGKALLKRCEKRVRAAKKRPSPVFKTWMRWDVPALPPSSFSSDLGWVESTGFGIYKARVNEPTCVLLAVKSKDGSLFDKGCLQRAAFMANMTSMPDGIKLYINTEPGDIR